MSSITDVGPVPAPRTTADQPVAAAAELDDRQRVVDDPAAIAVPVACALSIKRVEKWAGVILFLSTKMPVASSVGQRSVEGERRWSRRSSRRSSSVEGPAGTRGSSKDGGSVVSRAARSEWGLVAGRCCPVCF
jgi:hypothetical protein